MTLININLHVISGRVKALCQSLEDDYQCPGNPSRLGQSAGKDYLTTPANIPPE
jgi:hypothetical protein